MSIQRISNQDGHFACSNYGQQWAGPDGDRLTLALALLKQLLPETIALNSFADHLEYTPSVSIDEIIQLSTGWIIDEDASLQLHAHRKGFVVAITESKEEPQWPDFETTEIPVETQNELNEQWHAEVSGVSQGAYVSQAQHVLASSSRLGLMAQVNRGKLVWPPRQLNSNGQRIDSPTVQLSETATILTWTRLSAAGAPSEFSGRAPVLDGVGTVLVAFDEGPKGVFMLADDENGVPEIDGTVRFEIRRLYGQDGVIHYGLKAILTKS